jgi:hypothetical protein
MKGSVFWYLSSQLYKYFDLELLTMMYKTIYNYVQWITQDVFFMFPISYPSYKNFLEQIA